MQAYEAAKKLKMENKEFLEKYGMKSHMSKLSEDLVAELFGEEKKIEAEPEPTETVDSAETVVVEQAPEVPAEPEPEGCPVDAATVELSIRCLGGRSPYYKWRNLVG